MLTPARLLSVWFVILPLLRASELPELTLQLGPTNIGRGLSVPSGGDGANKPVTIQGSPARRSADEKSAYLYVIVNDSEYRKVPIDAYVTVEVFDDHFARVGCQYDKAAVTPNIAASYTDCGDTLLLTGSGKWRRAVFHLPELRLGHGQNHGADFRLTCHNVAVRSIALSNRKPAGYDASQPIDAESLRSLAVQRTPGMELTFGNDATAGDAAVFKALSVTSVESYVDWAGVEPKQGEWDWSRWDRQVATLQRAGLKWVPFLIAGCAYATPLWYHNGPNAVYYRCLEHGRETKVQSLFSPDLRRQVERFLTAFAERYRDQGVIESVLLGITGIYGESIYPAGPEGGWTARVTGNYHNHGGWWAGDDLAKAAFRKSMERRYANVAALNTAWQSSFGGFGEVSTFLPDKAPNDTARADFVEWYQQAMTDWVEFWVSTARKAFPTTEIYLCTGGDGNPMLGADFTAQTAVAARHQVGVRITNEGSDYANNFSVTREVATATRLYRTFCGFEPASHVDSNGVVARIYNATASGARQLHDYTPNTLGGDPLPLQKLRENLRWLIPRRPRVDAALYLSRETWALDPNAVGRTLNISRTLRDVADIDFVTRRSVADGGLKDIRALVLFESEVLEPGAAKAIEDWVVAGGTLVVVNGTNALCGSRLNDQSRWRERLFAMDKPGGTKGLVKHLLGAPAPGHWRLDVGASGDAEWLFSDWHPGEVQRWPTITNTMRWTGPHPGVLLPIRPGADYELRIRALVPRQALGAAGIAVRLNDQLIATVRKPEDLAITVPQSALGSESVARLELNVTAWKPSEREPGNGDNRSLGISVQRIELIRRGSEREPGRQALLREVIDAGQLSAITRRVGKGRTYFLPGAETRAAAAVFREALPGCPDGVVDGRFATVCPPEVLWLDNKTHRISQRK